jgi:MFS family permease
VLTHRLKGYDGSLMGSINSLKTYQAYYNVPENDLAGTCIVFSIFQIGQMAGALFIWVADWRGRRLPIFVGCLGVCVGACSNGKSSDGANRT